VREPIENSGQQETLLPLPKAKAALAPHGASEGAQADATAIGQAGQAILGRSRQHMLGGVHKPVRPIRHGTLLGSRPRDEIPSPRILTAR
jgi:hypothetical protein